MTLCNSEVPLIFYLYFNVQRLLISQVLRILLEIPPNLDSDSFI